MYRGLAFLIITCVVVYVLALVAFWVWRRPDVKRRQLREAREDAVMASARSLSYNRGIHEIRMRVKDYGHLDNPLATFIELEIEKLEAELKRLEKDMK